MKAKYWSFDTGTVKERKNSIAIVKMIQYNIMKCNCIGFSPYL